MSDSIFIHAGIDLVCDEVVRREARAAIEGLRLGHRMLAVEPMLPLSPAHPSARWTFVLMRLEMPSSTDYDALAARLVDALVEACQTDVVVEVIRLDDPIAEIAKDSTWSRRDDAPTAEVSS